MHGKKFVVFTTGRTGSTLIVDNLFAAGADTVIHTHDRCWVPPSDDFVCILSRRNKQFDATLSCAVMEVTQEIHHYSNRVMPFHIDPQRFTNMYIAHLQFYQQIKLDGYQEVVEIWFNKLMRKPKYLFEQLGEIRRTDYSLINKSPYDYSKLVKNYEELKEIAKHLDRRFYYINV